MKVLLGLLVGILALHPVHVSVTEITSDEKQRELEIVMRVFIDDLESAVRDARRDTEMDILNPEGVTTDQLLEEYILPRFRVLLDGKPQKNKYLGFEVEGQAILCYIQIANVGHWNTISVQNKAMIETFEDQSNLVNVMVRDEVKSLRLTRGKPEGTITFKTN